MHKHLSKTVWFSTILALCLHAFLSCETPIDTQFSGGASETGNTAKGKIKIETFDSPPTVNMDHLFLHIIETQANHLDSGWISLSNPDTVIDYLSLTNGNIAVVTDTLATVGKYNMIRFLLGDSNSVVVDGISHSLKTKGNGKKQIKVHVDFEIAAGNTATVMMDLDASRSVTAKSKKFNFTPVAKAFPKSRSASISGKVFNSEIKPMPGILITAAGTKDTTSTYSDKGGQYTLLVEEGLHTLFVTHASLRADTIYSDIPIAASQKLKGFDFVVQ